MIRQLPVSPSRDRPAQFSGEMDALLAALPGFVSDCNALEGTLQLVATTGTSTTTLAVGNGSKSLLTQPGKAWIVGAVLYVVDPSAPGNVMQGQLAAYDVDTGALSINVQTFAGSGARSNWVIGLAGVSVGAASTGANTFSGPQTLPGNAVNPLEAVPLQQLDSLAASMVGRNRIINGTFNINQRGVTGAVTLAAGIYGHDRWKAGSGGAAYTFTGETITITSGTLVQVIEGLNVPEGGSYVLSWVGTAQARVDGGAYSTSPIAVTGKTAGANTSVEFSTGTVTQVQYEAGTKKGSFDRRLYGVELALAQRYCRTLYANMVTSGFVQDYQFATMRGTPNVTFLAGISFTGGLLVGTSASSARQSTYSSTSGDGTALLTSEL